MSGTSPSAKLPRKPPRRITRAAIERILVMHASGLTLKAACEIENLDRSHVWNWLQLHEPQRYARAREASAHAMVDSINDKISNCNDPEQAALLRVKMDVVKWTASKVDPKNFGDKQTVAVERNDERIIVTHGHFIVRDNREEIENVIVAPPELPESESEDSNA